MNFNKLVLISVLGIVTISGCKSDKKEDAKATETPAFELSPQMQKELAYETAQTDIVDSELLLMGKVAPFEQKQVKVAPLVDGVIESLSANLGDFVKKGQVLAILHSSDVAEVENQTAASNSDLLNAQKTLQVNQDLYKAGLASEKDVTIAQNDLLKAKGALRRAYDISGIYGIKNSSYTLRAPIAGLVIDKNDNISEKMAYRETEIGSFFTIADLSSVQVVANVYESDISKIRVGFPVKIKLLAYPDKILQGKIDKISNALDPETRTMQVRVNLVNPGNKLKPEMFAEVRVSYNNNQKMVSIPAETVIFDKNKNFVVVYKDAKHVEIREIQIAQTTGSKSYISSGLESSEMVLSRNQLMIYKALSQ